VLFTPNGQLLIYAANRGVTSKDKIIVHAVDTWLPIWGLHWDKFNPDSLAISPDGTSLAIGGLLMVIPTDVSDRVQRLQQSRLIPNVDIVDLQHRQSVRVIRGDAMGGIAWSPDGSVIALAGRTYVEMFDAKSGERLVHERAELSGDMNVRFTPDGRYFIESDLNGMGKGLGVQLWDGRRAKLLQHIPGDIGSIAVSRDGKYLAVGATGRTTIWKFK
jgi:WD40 repeat protein